MIRTSAKMTSVERLFAAGLAMLLIGWASVCWAMLLVGWVPFLFSVSAGCVVIGIVMCLVASAMHEANEERAELETKVPSLEAKARNLNLLVQSLQARADDLAVAMEDIAYSRVPDVDPGCAPATREIGRWAPEYAKQALVAFRGGC